MKEECVARAEAEFKKFDEMLKKFSGYSPLVDGECYDPYKKS